MIIALKQAFVSLVMLITLCCMSPMIAGAAKTGINATSAVSPQRMPAHRKSITHCTDCRRHLGSVTTLFKEAALLDIVTGEKVVVARLICKRDKASGAMLMNTAIDTISNGNTPALHKEQPA